VPQSQCLRRHGFTSLHGTSAGPARDYFQSLFYVVLSLPACAVRSLTSRACVFSRRLRFACFSFPVDIKFLACSRQCVVMRPLRLKPAEYHTIKVPLLTVMSAVPHATVDIKGNEVSLSRLSVTHGALRKPTTLVHKVRRNNSTNMPQAVRSSASLALFRKSLKTKLFTRSYICSLTTNYTDS